MTTNDHVPANEKLYLGPLAGRLKGMGMTAGVVCLAAAIVWGLMLGDDMRRFMHAYLMAFTYFLSFALGGLFFVLMLHLTSSTALVAVRRLAEILTAAFPMLFVLSLGIIIPLWVGNKSLYLWSDPQAVQGDHILEAKAGYLNAPVFAIRMLIYFTIWMVLSRYFLKKSVEQDTTGDPALSGRMKKVAGPGMVLYALSTAWAGFDLLMSLTPHWFSTMWGVYYFAGAAVSVYALLAIMAFALQKSGRVTRSITVEHYHDCGKMTNAFTLFWAYIGFSQFMLIWVANIPEETSFFRSRMFTEWKWISLALIVLHFCIPFVGMMSRHVKRNPPLLALWCMYMLGVHLLDLYWVVMPAFSPEKIVIHPIDLLCVAGVGGLFLFGAISVAGNARLIPVRDPNLPVSLRFINQ